jgi:tetratricopeptide (TPR) repeat protein
MSNDHQSIDFGSSATPGGNGPRRKVSVYQREMIVALLQAALESGDYRFARQAAISWLAAFPGDLEITLLQAQAVIAEGKPAQVIPALELVCRKDPFFLEAYRALAWASRELDASRYLRAKTAAFALGDRIPEEMALEAWGKPLKEARQLFDNHQYTQALQTIEEVLHLEPELLLAHALQLLIVRAARDPQEAFHLAQALYSRWPDCLLAGLILAESYLRQGIEPDSVRMLHLGAAGDSTGQVARRLWGENHPYRSLWPDDMVIHFDLPVPAGVAGKMGWNRLSPGVLVTPAQPPAAKEAAPVMESPKVQQDDPDLESFFAIFDQIVNTNSPAVAEADGKTEEICAAPVAEKPSSAESEAEEIPNDFPTGADLALDPSGEDESPAVMQKKVESELEQLARKLKQPSLARADGRFPVYVIFSTRAGLNSQFGPQTTAVIDNELRRMAAVISKRRGWQAIIFYPDEEACAGQYGMLPTNAHDPWKLKHSLVDLDAALAKRGEMIGALLIIGGERVVPFHHLPNPTDDSDGDVVSDSPYASLDANYFVPEWPVGRLPGESGPDAMTLLEQIRQALRFHSHHTAGFIPFGKEWLVWVRAKLRALVPQRSAPSFGYTAAVWRRSSLAVFRPIGAPHTVLASPPAFSGGLKRKLSANLGYYNLHGLEDSPSWYGQRDPQETGAAPDYPVALSPEDLHRNGRSPKFVYSEACYGGHIFGKSEKNSLALKFLSLGAQGVVASTCISYGSISTPLIAADLLGNLFWKHLRTGKTAGEALMQAKIDLVREMNHRQGYLDGEDQKTLISFILYGDPLASYDGFRVRSKIVVRPKDHPMVRTATPEEQETLTPAKVPAEVLKGVKQIVAEYLPGADVAGIHFCRLQMNGNGKETHQGGQGLLGKKTARNNSERLVVTVSKQVQVAQHLHRHYLHVTMDEAGQTIKVALSR